jgi:hypothetical protein
VASTVAGAGGISPVYYSYRFFVVDPVKVETVYSIPVPASATYRVRLHFANVVSGKRAYRAAPRGAGRSRYARGLTPCRVSNRRDRHRGLAPV